jgi:hypothetical protein
VLKSEGETLEKYFDAHSYDIFEGFKELLDLNIFDKVVFSLKKIGVTNVQIKNP